jgi:hypothetical protein
MKKLIFILGIGFLLIFISWMPSIISEYTINDTSKTMYAFGFIRIDSTDEFEINGFVLAGINGNQVLTFERIQIKYDGSPILVIHPVPLIFIITYNPA